MKPEIFFQLLSDQTRLRCLVLLSEKKELCVCELVDILGIPQPKLSRHLSHLRKAGLILDRREKQWIYYRIHPEIISEIEEMLATITTVLKKQKPYTEDLEKLSPCCDKELCISNLDSCC